MKRFESHSQQFVSEQQEEYAHKQHEQFQQFDSALRDKDAAIQSLKQELTRHIQELDLAIQDAERRAQQPSPVFAAPSTQPYATPVEKKTLHALADVAQPVSTASTAVMDLTQVVPALMQGVAQEEGVELSELKLVLVGPV